MVTTKEIPMRLFVLSVMTVLLLSACNTMRGLGEDIESLGDGLSNTAEDAKD